ncbi:DUF5777 family beta-barrel protein [Crocinitomix catalasitica]|uniref:DUF5777 family beta-barrel protein n=1 Tax=Crocinitomix catalasitica TaxID=184607 RepID=UPI00056A4327|nr:DUF5777 family beta-barrel protein [Crocinitomix catalasitica]
MSQYKSKFFCLAIIIISTLNAAWAQDDLLDLLETDEPAVDYTIATFKSTKVVSGHSVETNAKGVLQSTIGHRFGRINGGYQEMFGIDNATIRFGFDYGLTDNMNIGFGRSSYQKTYDGTFKWKLLKQKSGAENFPITATWVSSIYINSQAWPEPDRENFFSSRLYYHHSVLLARKFSNLFSIQLMPTIVHRNLVKTAKDKNTVFSMGAATSIRLTKSLRLNAEYYFIPSGQIESTIGGEKVQNSLSVGIDIETGGHVFQLHITNSRGMTEKYLIGETTGNWLKGDIHFGFNVTRVFTLIKPKEFKDL